VHPAENRVLRELWALSGSLQRHWASLGARLADAEPEAAAILRDGAAATAGMRAALRDALTARDFYAETLAETAGRLVSPRMGVPDVVLERNQALRFAVLDVQHVVTTLGYAARLAGTRGDEDLRALLARAERDLAPFERRLRAAAAELGTRPDDAIAPASPTAAGRAGQRVGWAIGAVGEAVDRRIGKLRRR
jgi:hypothetical protein